jgi:hypothetical protein
LEGENLANISGELRGCFACPKCHIMGGGAKVRGKLGRCEVLRGIEGMEFFKVG